MKPEAKNENIAREVVGGVVLIVGVATLILSAEASAPVFAAVGAVMALGSGLYQAASAPKSRRHPRSGHTFARKYDSDEAGVELVEH